MTRRVVMLAAAVAVLATTPVLASPIGPVFPAPGGTTFLNITGTSGSTGGLTRSYTLLDPSGASYSDLWFGFFDIFVPEFSFFSNTLDTQGVLAPTIVGNEATWVGSSPWTIDNLGGADYVVPVRFRMTTFDTSNNPLALMSAAAVPGLTGSAGAVLNVGLLAGFIVNFGFEAFNGTTWVGVDSYFNLLQFTACTNCVGKSVNGGFWSEASATVPEPASLLFVGSGLLLGARRLRRSRTA